VRKNTQGSLLCIPEVLLCTPPCCAFLSNPSICLLTLRFVLLGRAVLRRHAAVRRRLLVPRAHPHPLRPAESRSEIGAHEGEDNDDDAGGTVAGAVAVAARASARADALSLKNGPGANGSDPDLDAAMAKENIIKGAKVLRK